ncbi:hypothetical protein [Proteiniphilum sp.]|uniref:hypothetical protein n=1 Tax=Proteiniphilum sp. TaxID=1926877 RepID=UPI003317A285
MDTPEKKSGKPAAITGMKPSALSLALICQFSQCVYVEKELSIPHKTMNLN